MILLTPELRAQLIANAADPSGDHLPVAKFFNPVGAGVWLATMLEPDGDTLHGIADLDMDCVDYGTFSLSRCKASTSGSSLASSATSCSRRPRRYRYGSISPT